jgi:hypothetical protein
MIYCFQAMPLVSAMNAICPAEFAGGVRRWGSGFGCLFSELRTPQQLHPPPGLFRRITQRSCISTISEEPSVRRGGPQVPTPLET